MPEPTTERMPPVLVSLAAIQMPFEDDPALGIATRIEAALRWSYETEMHVQFGFGEQLAFDLATGDTPLCQFKLAMVGADEPRLYGRTVDGGNPCDWPAIVATSGMDPAFAWVPVLLMPPTGIPESYPVLSLELRQGIAAWFAAQQPSTDGATLEFELTLFEAADAAPVPLAHFQSIAVAVGTKPLSWWHEAAGERA